MKIHKKNLCKIYSWKEGISVLRGIWLCGCKRICKYRVHKLFNGIEDFVHVGSLGDGSIMEAKSCWIIHETRAPALHNIALKLLGQPCSSFYCERNWNILLFYTFFERNKMTPKRTNDLVFVHSNLRLLSKKLLKIQREN